MYKSKNTKFIFIILAGGAAASLAIIAATAYLSFGAYLRQTALYADEIAAENGDTPKPFQYYNSAVRMATTDSAMVNDTAADPSADTIDNRAKAVEYWRLALEHDDQVYSNTTQQSLFNLGYTLGFTSFVDMATDPHATKDGQHSKEDKPLAQLKLARDYFRDILYQPSNAQRKPKNSEKKQGQLQLYHDAGVNHELLLSAIAELEEAQEKQTHRAEQAQSPYQIITQLLESNQKIAEELEQIKKNPFGDAEQKLREELLQRQRENRAKFERLRKNLGAPPTPEKPKDTDTIPYYTI